MGVYIYSSEWHPTSRTLLYFPFREDLVDHSGKEVASTNTGSPAIVTSRGVKCCQLNGSSAINISVNYSTLNSTLMGWFKGSTTGQYFIGAQPCGITQGIAMSLTSAPSFNVVVYNGSTGTTTSVSGNYQNAWHHFAVSNGKIYVDGVYKTSFSGVTLGGTQPICVGGHNVNSSCTRSLTTGYVGEVIYESGEWTAEEIANYYNNTKDYYVETGYDTKVVVDFRSAGGGNMTAAQLISTSDFVSQSSGYTCASTGSNGTLRLSIPATDKSAHLNFMGRMSNGYSNGDSWQNGKKQNLIKKMYMRIETLYAAESGYPIFSAAGVNGGFSIRKNSTNINGNNYVCQYGFALPRGDMSSWRDYIKYPIDSNTQYLVLPTSEHYGNGQTCTGYVNQGTSCIYSRLTLEVRGDAPSNFHYWLIVGATGNEYDLGLCSGLGSCDMSVGSGDWWQVGSYKEISEAYLEVFDGLYIDGSGNITTTKPW